MNISIFGYILLALVILLAAYLMSVARVEPPLESYESSGDAEREPPPADLPARLERPEPGAADGA
jgi:hypothetical protein